MPSLSSCVSLRHLHSSVRSHTTGDYAVRTGPEVTDSDRTAMCRRSAEVPVGRSALGAQEGDPGTARCLKNSFFRMAYSNIVRGVVCAS